VSALGVIQHVPCLGQQCKPGKGNDEAEDVQRTEMRVPPLGLSRATTGAPASWPKRLPFGKREPSQPDSR
jgi:hypothetical protein